MSRGRGFTVVELLLALSLAGMVMAAAIGVYSMLNTADRVSERQMDEDVQLAAAQSVVRRAMQSLLAGQDTLDPSALAGNGDADAASDGQDIATVQAVSQTHGRSMFEIFFEEPEPGVVTPFWS
ncbi:MAG: type II secretion system protein, partial [Planctomycetota bacterium]